SGVAGLGVVLRRGRVEMAVAFRLRAGRASDALYDRVGAVLRSAGRFVLTNVQLGPAVYSPEQRILQWRCLTREGLPVATSAGTGAAHPKSGFSQHDGYLDVSLAAAPELADKILAAQERLPIGHGEMTADIVVALETIGPRESQRQMVENLSGIGVVNLAM